MQLKLTVLSVAIAMTWGSFAHAESLQDKFNAANGNYWNKEYKQAQAGYLNLVDRYDVHDPVVFYNLGNCSFELKSYGWAVLYYKRALESGPSEALERKIKDNLGLSHAVLQEQHRRDIRRSVAVLDESHGVLYSLSHLLTSNQTAMLFALMWCLLFVGLIARRFVASEERRSALKTVTIALFFMTVTSGTLFVGNQLTSVSVVRGIIVSNSVQMRDGKHPDAPASDVPEGLEVRIMDDTDPNETRIQLSNGKEGWVPSNTVKSL